MTTLVGTGNEQADTAALQAAFDGGLRDITLQGSFKIREPLQMGAYTQLSGNNATLSYSYYAPPTHKPLLTVKGMGSRVQGLNFYCNRRCRGLRFDTDVSTELLRDVRVHGAVELAVDLWDCWGASAYNVQISECLGVSLRTHRCNMAYLERVWIYDGRLLEHADKTKNVELWKCAHRHGNTATQKKYGDDYRERWPRDVAESDRALVVLDADQDLARFVGLRLEPYAVGDYPTISCRALNTTIEQLYFETGYHYRKSAMVRLVNAPNTEFRQVRIVSQQQPQHFLMVTNSPNALIDGMYVYTPPHGIAGSLVDGDCEIRRQAGYPTDRHPPGPPDRRGT